MVVVFSSKKSYFLTTTKNICCWWWCYNFFANCVKTNTFVDFFCFVDLFLLLLFLLLLLCLLLPGSVVLLFPFLRFPEKAGAAAAAAAKDASSDTTVVLVDDDAHAGTTLVSSPPIEDAGDGGRMPMALVSSSSSSSPPVVSSIRMEVDDDVLLGTTPTKGVFRNVRLPVSPMDVHVSRALCVVIKNGYKSQMSFRFPTTSSKTCFKKTRWMRRPRARKKKKAPPPFSRRSLSRALSRSRVALPFAFSGGVVGARVSNNNPRAVRRLFF